MEKDKLYGRIFRIAGLFPQMDVCVEEMSELTKALIKFKRYGGARQISDVAEEIADVEIMLEQMKTFFGISDEVTRMKEFKLERLEKRLNEGALAPREVPQVEYTDEEVGRNK